MKKQRKNCICCKKKRDIKKLELVGIKNVSFGMYACREKPECLHYQIKELKK